MHSWLVRVLVAVAAAVVVVPQVPRGASGTSTEVQVNAVLAGPFPKNKQNEPSLAQNPVHPDAGAHFGSPLKISTATSDPDGSSTNSLGAQFLGDYITAVAGPDGVFVVWTDSRNATPCASVDAFRAGTAPKPNVISGPNKCPTTFGNTDIFLRIVSP